MSMSSVRSRFLANVGVLNVAFSPFITEMLKKNMINEVRSFFVLGMLLIAPKHYYTVPI